MAIPPTKIPSTPIAGCCEVHMHLDTDRDGKVDNDWKHNDLWQLGFGNKGAIIVYNCDSDQSRPGIRDCDDNLINGIDDIADIAPLDIRKTSSVPLPPSVSILFEVTSNANCIRLFKQRKSGAVAIIGKGHATSYRFTEKDFTGNKIELGMEATTFPHKYFDGYITFKLSVEGWGKVGCRNSGSFV